MKVNIYVVVFGVIAALLVIAALTVPFFNQMTSGSNLTLASLKNYGPAPQLAGISGWINSQQLNLSALHGKVVLIDFWTYSCINCIRTIPYLNSWENKYGNNGLVIIGVSTPEFAFEANYTNVKNAVQRFGIRYPVALDNNYLTWQAYNNHYWPADYLIDKNGNVRDVHFGEGSYNQTEQTIQLLLRDAGYPVQANFTPMNQSINLSKIGSPELYLGYATARAQIGNREGFSPGNVVNYAPMNITQGNTAYFYGNWLNLPDSMVSANNSRLFLVYSAKYVNVVASGNSSVVVKLDGQLLGQQYFGSDVHLRGQLPTVNVTSPRLYNTVAGSAYGTHALEIDAQPGFRIYTFTFG